MKVTKKEINMLIGLLGVLIAVLVYFFVYTDYKDKTASLQAESASLQPKAEAYEAANARLDEYELGIVSNQNEFNSIVDHYPVDIKIDDAAMLWNNFDKAYPEDIRFNDLEIEELDVVAVEGVTDTGDAEVTDNGDGTRTFMDEDIEEITANYTLYGFPTGMNFRCSNAGMLKLFEFLNSQHNRNSLMSLSLEYDEEYGCIVGEIWVEQYYLEGTGREYSPVFVPTVPKGQSNLFHIGDASLEEFRIAHDEEDGEKLSRDPYGDYNFDDAFNNADDNSDEDEDEVDEDEEE